VPPICSYRSKNDFRSRRVMTLSSSNGKRELRRADDVVLSESMRMVIKARKSLALGSNQSQSTLGLNHENPLIGPKVRNSSSKQALSTFHFNPSASSVSLHALLHAGRRSGGWNQRADGQSIS